MNKKIIISFISIMCIVSVSLLYKIAYRPDIVNQVGSIGSDARACQMATSTVMVIGKDIPTFVAATSSSRARFSLQGQFGATTTLALAFNGKVATTGTNFILPNGVGYSVIVGGRSAAGTTTPIFVSGLATDNPYVGAISAISLDGTSTALVSECRYQ